MIALIVLLLLVIAYQFYDFYKVTYNLLSAIIIVLLLDTVMVIIAMGLTLIFKYLP